MEFDILIVSVGNPYSFNDDSGKKIEGCSVMYLMTSDKNLKPVVNEDSGLLGYQLAKETFPVDFYERAKAVGIPSVAKGHFCMRVVGGKQTLKMDGLDFVADKLAK